MALEYKDLKVHLANVRVRLGGDSGLTTSLLALLWREYCEKLERFSSYHRTGCVSRYTNDRDGSCAI